MTKINHSVPFKICVTGSIIAVLLVLFGVIVPASTTAAVSKPSTNATSKTIVPSGKKSVYYPVVQIVDGDTIKINKNGTKETIRLIGVDTPETVDPRKTVQCFGKEASNKAKLLLTGKKVRIDLDATQGERDKYGRLLAYVYRDDGLFINEYMVKEGYAYEYTYATPYKYQKQFKVDQKNAELAKRGLWSPQACAVTTLKPVPTVVPTSLDKTQSTSAYYTSSFSTTKYYYPANCSAWKSLSTSYLKKFDSLQSLLAKYPARKMSPQCQ